MLRALPPVVAVFNALLVCASAVAELPTDHATVLDNALQPLLHSEFAPLTAQSCAANACHGNARPGIADPYACRGSEYPLWVQNDPHANARRTLCSPKSVRMLELLRIMEHGEIVDEAGYHNCLKCHTTTVSEGWSGLARGAGAGEAEPPFVAAHPVSEVRSAHSPKVECGCQENELAIHEGVGCASCHGPAEAWIGTHYKPHFGDIEKAATGFVQLEDLVVRARVCASCHIGDSDRDMNHDIIAAGHPPLRYEFATYHNRLPKHWRDDHACDSATYEAQLWLAGQIAALDASIKLLESRAAERNPVSVWPEFAEYDCGSCHHTQRLVGASGIRRPTRGLARYSAWNQTGMRIVLQHGELIDQLDILQSLMESKRIPDAPAVRAVANEARRALDTWLLTQGQQLMLHFDAGQLNCELTASARSLSAVSSWEVATQHYLAAVAGRSAWPGGPLGPVSHTAQLTRRALEYPAERDIERQSRETDEPIDAAARLRTLLESIGPYNHDESIEGVHQPMLEFSQITP